MSSAPPTTSASPDRITGSLSRTQLEGNSIAGSSGMSYRPLLELGEGGMARIMLALASGPGGFNKLVVLKVVRTGHDTPEIRRMLLAEARLSARLNHPNVVQVHEVVHAAESPCLVMEYLDGRPVSALQVSETITASMLMTVISEALVGLHYAHELSDFDGTPLNIVHRDVSPHNVFMTYDGVVKVLDFGIAKMAHAASLTETGEIKGKLAYMPPEQLLGESMDRRADIFAVGCMLWEAATGLRMWRNVSQATLMQRLMSGNIPKPSTEAAIDPELERIIVKATAPAPEDRYETAHAMQCDLDAYLNSKGQRATLRDLGARLAETFKQERQQRARAIKEALKRNSISPVTNQQLDLLTSSESKILPNEKPSRTLVVGLVLTAVIIVGLSLALRAKPGTAPAAVREIATVPSAIAVSVQATPAQAKIKIDHREYAQPSISLALPRDDQPHTIEVFADGYVSDTRSVSFSQSLTLEVSLHRAAPAAPTELPVAPVVSSKTRTAPARNGAHKTPPSAPADCDPPYFFDHGIKTYKPQCL